MKDYRLSEIQAICEKMHNEFGENACIYCENNGLGDFCTVEFENYPTDWYVDIEPRDMLELPCKMPYNAGDTCEVRYVVLYMKDNGDVSITNGYTEAQADTVLEQLRGDKK